ncbi:hypothetical protein [Flavobacterium alkalisoli]|uniref:hypothetical protein n=1 Tax=Flavobacterium alkalisoli TaxID=2602769 RepID=UPI003A8DFBC5
MITLSCFAQQDTLSTQKFDDFVSVKMQGPVTKMDTIMDNLEINAAVSGVENSVFVFQRLKVGNSEDMPYDFKSLKDFYTETNKGIIDKTEESSGYKLLDTTIVDISGFKALRSSFGENKNKKIEFIVLYLGGYMYSFAYTNALDYNEKEKTDYFKSITIEENNPGQFTGESFAYRLGEKLGGLSIVLIVVLIVVLIIRSKRKK